MHILPQLLMSLVHCLFEQSLNILNHFNFLKLKGSFSLNIAIKVEESKQNGTSCKEGVKKIDQTLTRQQHKKEKKKIDKSILWRSEINRKKGKLEVNLGNYSQLTNINKQTNKQKLNNNNHMQTTVASCITHSSFTWRSKKQYN